VQVGASADDGENSTNIYSYTNTQDYVGRNGAHIFSDWYRFAGITMPQGSTVTTSYCSIYGAGYSGTPYTRFYGDKENNPTYPTSRADYFGRPTTTASVALVGYLGDGWQNTPSLVSIIQELSNTYAYNNQAIQILEKDDGGSGTWHYSIHYSWDYSDHTYGPKLHVEYTPPPTIVIFRSSGAGGSSGWISGYNYRKKITLAGTTAGAQTNYQMNLIVYKGSGTDSGSSVYLNNHVQDSFNDIRFTKSDGATPLDFWIESTTTASSSVWIEFDSIPASPSTATFYIYYSNPSASSGSNGTNAFIFFDDFEDGTLNKWSSYGAGDSNYNDGGNKVLKIKTADGDTGIIATISHSNALLHFRYKIVSIGSYGPRLTTSLRRSADGSNAYVMFNEVGGGNNKIYIQKYVSGSGTIIVSDGTTYSTGVWYEDNYISGAGTSIGGKIAGSTTMTVTDSSVSSGTTIAYGSWDSGNIAYIDNVYLRNDCSPEPTWGTWGSEEIAPMIIFRNNVIFK